MNCLPAVVHLWAQLRPTCWSRFFRSIRALCKRPSERYTTAKDLGDELRRFMTRSPGMQETVSLKGLKQVETTVADRANQLSRSLSANLKIGSVGCSLSLAVAAILMLAV